MEIVKGIHLLKTPIPKRALGILNSYLVKTDEGCLLIDTGWPSTAAFNALMAEIADAGVSMGDIRYILLTHTHPDHVGLVEPLRQQTGAKLIVNETEQYNLESFFQDFDAMVKGLSEWLQLHDVRDQIWQNLNESSVGMNTQSKVSKPDRTVRGGEHFTIGDFDFEILLTPGHSEGHICLYERSRQLLLSGDHILPNIIPTVGVGALTADNQMIEYMSSLRQLEALPVKLVLPAHGDPFYDLPKRIAEIRQHHEERQRIIAQAFGNGPITTREVIEALRGTAGDLAWSELSPLKRIMALSELNSQLELMNAEGRLDKTLQDGTIRWTLRRAVDTDICKA